MVKPSWQYQTGYTRKDAAKFAAAVAKIMAATGGTEAS